MPDPMIALRALRQIRGGGDSPIRRLAERAAGQRMAGASVAPMERERFAQRMDPGPIATTEREADDEGRAERLMTMRSDYEADRYADDMPDPVLTRMMFDERAAGAPAAGDAFISRAYKTERGRPGMEMEIDPKEGSIEIELGDAMRGLSDVFAGLPNDYAGREPLRGGSEPPPAYLAAGEAPRVGGMEDDEDDLDRSVAALFRGR